MDPATSNDFRPDHRGAVFDIDANNDDYHALFGQDPPIAQDAASDIAHDAVDIEVARRDLRGWTQPSVVEGDLVAVGANDDLRGSHTHLASQLCMGNEMAVLAMHGHEMLRAGDGQKHLEVFCFGVTRSVHIGDTGVNNFSAGPDQTIDHLGNIGFVSGNRVRTHDDNVGVAQGKPTVFIRRHERQRRHRFALRTCGDDAHFFGREVADIGDIHESRFWNVEKSHFASHTDVLLHRHSHGGDDSIKGNRCISNLLHPVNVTGEAGRNDATTLIAMEQVVEHGAHRRF
ncbi:unannotated protein [freshwater metagenome]|uniref:Unannotated protein n=2 Tax=freshwater metagenome TaxID=449393 RepID=A0A6J7LFV7_9ZZZZ